MTNRDSLRRSSSALFLVLATVFGVACSSSSPSAQEVVCTDAGNLKDAASELVDDVKSGNFGDAKDQLSTVKSDADALESSVKDLASSKQDAVRSDLDSVKTTLGSLSSATSLNEIENTLSDAESQLTNTLGSITDTLSC